MAQTDEQKLEDLISLGQRVRARVHWLAEKLEALPWTTDEKTQALVTWRCVLLTLAWDVSESSLILAKHSTEQIRAIRIVNRSLFEYCTRLEFYAYDQERAVKDWKNAFAWLALIIKGGTTALC
jgi:hypothetical protein